MISDFLVDYADQMGSLGVEFEGEIAFGVGLGAAGFFHALAEAEEDDFVACGGLVGGGVFYGAGQGLGGGEGGEQEEMREMTLIKRALRDPCENASSGREALLRGKGSFDFAGSARCALPATLRMTGHCKV